MDLNEYQRRAHETAIYTTLVEYDEEGKRDIPITDDITGLAYTALGLNGEAGEFAEEVKKMIRNDKGNLTTSRKLRMIAELGDVLWYLASAAKELGVDLEHVADYNLNKLAKRYADR